MLMMFYIAVCGWMFYYVYKMASGGFEGATAQEVGSMFSNMLANPSIQTGWMVVLVAMRFPICSGGLQKGVECITKGMMLCLLGIMAVLCVRALTLPGAAEGLRFYLVQDFDRMLENGLGDAAYVTICQAFLTIRLGIGA